MTTTSHPALNDAARAAPFATATGSKGVYTRADLFRDSDSGAWGQYAHRRFYGEIVQAVGLANPRLLQDVLKLVTRERCEVDRHLNNTSLNLRRWDAFAAGLNTPALREAFKVRGDFVSEIGLLCILKEAVMQCHGFPIPGPPEGEPNQSRPRGRQRADVPC